MCGIPRRLPGAFGETFRTVFAEIGITAEPELYPAHTFVSA
jgi:hypothetical protein